MPSSCLCLEIHETLKIRGGRRAWSGAKWGEGEETEVGSRPNSALILFWVQCEVDTGTLIGL